MNRFARVVVVVLILSLCANGWLSFRMYKSSEILRMDTGEYNSFKSSLHEAMKATDDAVADPPGSLAQKNDMYAANMSLNRAMGFIMGLRTDLAKKGMDVFPIFTALGESESPGPHGGADSNDRLQNTLVSNSKTLHELYSILNSTSFSDTELPQLRNAIKEIDSKYPGAPSYSSLQ